MPNYIRWKILVIILNTIFVIIEVELVQYSFLERKKCLAGSAKVFLWRVLTINQDFSGEAASDGGSGLSSGVPGLGRLHQHRHSHGRRWTAAF